MGSYNETRDQFSDTHDDGSSISDISSNNNEDFVCSEIRDSSTLEYEFWTKEPDSVYERRTKFLNCTGLSSNLLRTDTDEEFDSCNEDNGSERFLDKDEAFFEISKCERKLSSSSSIQSSCSYKTTYNTEDGHDEEDTPIWKIKSLDNGAEFVIDDYADDGTPKSLLEVGSDKIISIDEFLKTLGSSSLVQHLLRKDSSNQVKIFDTKNNLKSNSWLHRFIHRTHSEDKAKDFHLKPYDTDLNKGSAIQKVRVHVYKKDTKELSSLCTGQEFAAHEGSILTMKFSPDGRYLASAGDDGVVRIWKVLEDDVDKLKIQESNPSCLYFSLNQFSKLTPLNDPKEENGQFKSLKNKKSSHPTCAILPPTAFQLSEKPLHEFQGHEGKVLALSWSKNGHLLSSSVDNTARLWRLENNQCGQVYSHNSYVTCVEFNPVDDNQFISGSVDGKLRIWDVQRGRVIDWTDIREIVTALCYCPNGKGGIVGSMDGNCHYYDFIDNRLLLGDEIRLNEKKKKTRKLPSKRITGFQYCPSDSSKVMVTSADSKVRILSGTSVICKLKGNNNSKSQVPACFTSDGQHVVLTTEDSKIRLWNYTNPDETKSPRSGSVMRSSESFLSRNASIAIPWCGLKNKIGSLHGAILGYTENITMQKRPDRFTTNLGVFLDTLHKVGSVTWPEEKLSKTNLFSGKPDFKFLKNTWLNAMSSPHSWGLVIVTAGWDGCIRTFLNYGLPVRF